MIQTSDHIIGFWNPYCEVITALALLSVHLLLECHVEIASFTLILLLEHKNIPSFRGKLKPESSKFRENSKLWFTLWTMINILKYWLVFAYKDDGLISELSSNPILLEERIFTYESEAKSIDLKFTPQKIFEEWISYQQVLPYIHR